MDSLTGCNCLSLIFSASPQCSLGGVLVASFVATFAVLEGDASISLEATKETDIVGDCQDKIYCGHSSGLPHECVTCL